MSKDKGMTEEVMNDHIAKAIGVMQNYGFLGLTKAILVKDSSAMRFFQGVLRQQGLTESQIEEVKKYLENNSEEKQ